MIIPLVRDGDPDQIFLSVHNTSATTLTKGRCVAYNYGTITHTTASTLSGNLAYNDGHGVRMPSTAAATSLDNPVHFAGVVAGKDIPPYSSGSVQAWGFCDLIYLSAYTTIGTTAFTTNVISQGNFNGLVLRPFDAFITNATDTQRGMMVAVLEAATQASAANMPFYGYVPGGYAGLAYWDTATTLTNGSTAPAKAHLRFI